MQLHDFSTLEFCTVLFPILTKNYTPIRRSSSSSIFVYSQASHNRFKNLSEFLIKTGPICAVAMIAVYTIVFQYSTKSVVDDVFIRIAGIQRCPTDYTCFHKLPFQNSFSRRFYVIDIIYNYYLIESMPLFEIEFSL